MRLDSRRPEDRRIGRHCEYWQNGEMADAGTLAVADENLGIMEHLVVRENDGPIARWQSDAAGEPKRRCAEGPVVIRLKDGAPPEIAKLYRERRRQEQRI